MPIIRSLPFVTYFEQEYPYDAFRVFMYTILIQHICKNQTMQDNGGIENEPHNTIIRYINELSNENMKMIPKLECCDNTSCDLKSTN